MVQQQTEPSALFTDAVETSSTVTETVYLTDGSKVVGQDPFKPLDASIVPEEQDALFEPVTAEWNDLSYW